MREGDWAKAIGRRQQAKAAGEDADVGEDDCGGEGERRRRKPAAEGGRRKAKAPLQAEAMAKATPQAPMRGKANAKGAKVEG